MLNETGTPAPVPSCPRCGASVTEGWIRDRAPGSITAAYWIEEAPKRSIWSLFSLLTRRREHHRIQAYRCTRCGRLELYANES